MKRSRRLLNIARRIWKTAMGKTVAQELRELGNDHLYKLVQLRLQTMLQFSAGSTASSKTTVVNNVRSRSMTDHAMILYSNVALWKPAPVFENRRSRNHNPVEYTTPHSHSRVHKMFFCNFTSAIVNIQKVTEFVTCHHWPFL